MVSSLKASQAKTPMATQRGNRDGTGGALAGGLGGWFGGVAEKGVEEGADDLGLIQYARTNRDGNTINMTMRPAVSCQASIC